MSAALPPLKLYWLPSGQYTRRDLKDIDADYILLTKRYHFVPPQIFFEDVRLSAPAKLHHSYGEPVRLKATKHGITTGATEIIVRAESFSASLDEIGLSLDLSDWFHVGRGGEQPLVDRLAKDRHGVKLLELVAPWYALPSALSNA